MSDRLGYRVSRGIKLSKPAPLKRPPEPHQKENDPVVETDRKPTVRKVSRSQLKLTKPPPLRSVQTVQTDDLKKAAPDSTDPVVSDSAEFHRMSYTSQVSQDSGIADIGGTFSRENSLLESRRESISEDRRHSNQDDLDWDDVDNDRPAFTFGARQLQATSYFVNQLQPFNSLMVDGSEKSKVKTNSQTAKGCFQKKKTKAEASRELTRYGTSMQSDVSTRSVDTYRRNDDPGSDDPDGTLAYTPVPGTPLSQTRKQWSQTQDGDRQHSEMEEEWLDEVFDTYNVGISEFRNGRSIQNNKSFSLSSEVDFEEAFKIVSKSMDYRTSKEMDTNSTVSKSSTSVDVQDISSNEESFNEQTYAWKLIEDLSDGMKQMKINKNLVGGCAEVMKGGGEGFNEQTYARDLIEDLSEHTRHQVVEKESMSKCTEVVENVNDTSIDIEEIEKELQELDQAELKNGYAFANHLTLDKITDCDDKDLECNIVKQHIVGSCNTASVESQNLGKLNSYSSLKNRTQVKDEFHEAFSVSKTGEVASPGSAGPVTSNVSPRNYAPLTSSDSINMISLHPALSFGELDIPFVIIQRQPLSPTSLLEEIFRVEEGQQGGLYSSKGRRAMFRSYRMSVMEESLTSTPTIKYSADELLDIGCHGDSMRMPDSWSYLSMIHPEVCLSQVEHYFDAGRYKEERSYVVEVCCVQGGKTGKMRRQESLDSATSNPPPKSVGFGRPPFARQHSDSSALVSSETRSMRSGGFGTPPEKRAERLTDGSISNQNGTGNPFQKKNVCRTTVDTLHESCL